MMFPRFTFSDYTPEFCLPYFFFSAPKSKMNSNIKTFIENELPVKDNQIHVSVTARSMKSLPPKLGG